MPQINFPDNPTNGQEHTEGSITWVFDGIKWNLKPLSDDYATRGANDFVGNQTIDGSLQVTGPVIHQLSTNPLHSATVGQVDAYSNRLVIVENKIENIENSINTRTFGIDLDGSGSPVSTGLKGYIVVPYACEIMSWSLVADTVGSIEIDIWRSNVIPNGGNTICAGNRPRLIAQQLNTDAVLTGWDKIINQGDIIAFNVVSSSTVTKVNLVIKTKLS